MFLSWVLFPFLLLANAPDYCASVVLNANDTNFDSLIAGYDITLLKFSADWCYFSQLLAPIFEQAAEKAAELTKSGKAAFISIDCEANQNLCTKQYIRKYPTIKITKYGKILKSEYRNERTVEAFLKFIEDNLKFPVEIIDGHNATPAAIMNSWINKSVDTKCILALVNNMNAENSHMNLFKKVAAIEQSACNFYIYHNLSMNDERLALYDPISSKVTSVTLLKNADLTAIDNWVKQQCISLVREITFSNAEEITEERLPLMLLFYNPDNKTIASRFTEFVNSNLAHHQSTINIVTANGVTFSHPLAHLGKSKEDLPFICLDSFAHMYVFPGSVEMALSDPKHLNQFVEDLKSGKLHMEYHYGSNSDSHTTSTSPKTEHEEPTTPHVSVFQHLTPSRMRYTIIHDEF
ncbi:Thioredoxin domain-containing protein [Schistosoma japonicum]|uniref:Thioredoxin domain-containing protein n=2 Tax=Schistosoma japonicum TaxID=6182 RepID=C7TY45_SCHJA|nr:Thioredoxin domain-containing protein [Schistosoma japonicum]CAX82521.1 Thioredoxin domain-containing protein 4 precursor [Schistosoma japonicum]